MQFDWQKEGKLRVVEVQSGRAEVARGIGTMKVYDWWKDRTKTCPVWECVIYDSDNSVIGHGSWPSMEEAKTRAECALIAAL